MFRLKRESEKKDDIKPDWKDFIAITIAVYEILLLPILLIVLAIAGFVILFYLIFG